MKPVPFADLAQYAQADRIRLIVNALHELPAGRIVGILVDAPKLPEYRATLESLCPDIVFLPASPAPTPGVELLRFYIRTT